MRGRCCTMATRQTMYDGVSTSLSINQVPFKTAENTGQFRNAFQSSIQINEN